MDLFEGLKLIHLYGVLVGLVFGGLVGLFKYVVLWRRFFIKLSLPEQQSNIDVEEVGNVSKNKSDGNAIMKRMLISYVINVVALVAVLLVRNKIPFEFVSTAIGTAIGLSVSGRFFPLHKILKSD